MATQAAASNPGYAKSYEGKELIAAGINPGSDAWIQHFGLPQIIATSTYQSPAYTGEFDDNWASAIKTTGTGDFIYSGQGQHLIDQYDDPTGSYQEQVDDYYEIREAEQAQQTPRGHDYNYYGGYGPGYSSGIAGFGLNPLAFFKGRGRGYDLGTTMLDPDSQGVATSQIASNMLKELSEGAKAFSLDPKTAGILAILDA